MPSKNDPARLDQKLAERLRRGEESVLADILRDLAPRVRSRLRSHFGSFLAEGDYDDVLSMALYRLWMARAKYDPEKGSLLAWFYLIARALAWDFLRQRPRLVPYPAEALAELAGARPPRGAPVPPSEDLKRLTAALDGLAEIDRRILLAFASRAHQEDWTSDLVAELGMPASTIRVRKFRALAELRELLGTAGASASKGNTPMTSSARASDPNLDFVQSHRDVIQGVARKLLLYKERRARTQARGGLAQVEAEWNAALAGESYRNDRNLEGLKKTYAWLTALASSNPEHRDRLKVFLGRVPFDRHRPSGSTPEQLGDLEQAFSAVATKIELTMPGEVCRAGAGDVLLEYPTNDVGLRWQTNQSAPPLSLRDLVTSALDPSPRFAGPAADAVATGLVKTVRDAEDLPLPNLSYPAGARKRPPQKLTWRRAKPPEPKLGEGVPAWMHENRFAPSGEALDLFRNDPELAGLLEKVAIDAALVDWQRRQAHGEDAGTAGAVPALVQALVERSGLTKPEIAALLAPGLFERQQRVASAQECAANTSALALLWAEISG